MRSARAGYILKSSASTGRHDLEHRLCWHLSQGVCPLHRRLPIKQLLHLGNVSRSTESRSKSGWMLLSSSPSLLVARLSLVATFSLAAAFSSAAESSLVAMFPLVAMLSPVARLSLGVTLSCEVNSDAVADSGHGGMLTCAAGTVTERDVVVGEVSAGNVLVTPLVVCWCEVPSPSKPRKGALPPPTLVS